MRGRGAQKTAGLLERHMPSAVRGEITEECLTRHFAANPPAIMQALGQPYLLRATIPKEMALAWIRYDALIHSSEIFVDFEKHTPAMIEDVTPAEYRWAA